MMRSPPKFEAMVQDLLAYLQGAELIIHNAPFDVGFLNKEFSLLGLPPLTHYVEGITDSLAMAKEMFPGKRNSLDALCSRLDVDNSGRTLHGALLDAELLADVYINMTRGQNALVMPEDDESPQEQETSDALPVLDLRAMVLPVLKANEQELAAHDAVLADLDKSSGGKTIWRIGKDAAQAVT